METLEETNKKIAEKFRDYLAMQLKSGVNWTTYNYVDSPNEQKRKKQITVALIFWRFLRKIQRYGFTQKQKREFVLDFLDNDPISTNSYCRVTAMIEALPTSIWRKLLWRENIDFSDYEPCLRRLSREQIKAIEDNFNDLFSLGKPVVPRVLKKSWRDRIKLFFGKISIEEILNENYDDVKRNKSKGAYAFSLLGLDFGFSLYPKGDNNDAKITNQKYTRFLSVKEHINDFVVNKEDGKYWWLYRTARSNYAINPNADIKMKTHVCPGFWLTLILHGLFWIVSPVALIFTGIVIGKAGFTPAALIPLAFASEMILWTVFVLARIVFKLFAKLFKMAGSNKISKAILIALAVIIGAAIALVVVGFIFWGIGITIAFLSKICGPLLSVLSVLTAIFYVVFFFTSIAQENPSYEYDDVPKTIRFIMHLIVFSFVVVMFDKFLSYWLINFIVNCATGFWRWYTSNLLITNWLILSVVFFGLFIYFFSLFLSNEKLFAKAEKVLMCITKGFLGLSLIVFILLFAQTDHWDIMQFGLAPVLFLSVIFLIFAASMVMMDKVNLQNIEERSDALAFINRINNKLGNWTSKTYVDRILQNKWLLAIEEGERWRQLYRISDLAFYYFSDSYSYPYSYDYRTRFTDLIISKGSLEILKCLEDENQIKDAASDHGEIMMMITLVTKGKSIDEAIAQIEKRRLTSEKIIGRLKTVGNTTIYPFKKIYRAIEWLVEKIAEFLGTLKDLWELFNKRCPFIAESRYLD